MSDLQGQLDAEKETLETEKLLLEKRVLQSQLSVSGQVLAWLQAASVPVALLGAILAFFVGFGQLRQGADSQAADRFDKALTRLASERSDERMAGVSGLNLFLNDSNSPLQSQALQFLINRLSLETDARVQGIILDVITDLKPGYPSQQALDDGLRTAVERDRSLTKSIVSAWRKRIIRQQKLSLEKAKVNDLGANEFEIPAQIIEALSIEQYLALLDAEHGPFERLEEPENMPLRGLSNVI